MTDEENLKNTEILHFGALQYDRNSGEITDAAGAIKHLRRQSADVLSFLVTKAGQVVSKDQLIENLWPSGVATDDSLIQCIADIRRILGREAILTYPKKGYQLQIKPIEQAPNKGLKIPQLSFVGLATCAVIVLVAIVLAWELSSDGKQIELVQPPIVESGRTLAVLPFSNLGGDPEIQYFSDGLSEILATDLSKVAGLTVIAFASSAEYPNAERGFRQIAQELQVRYLVRGTVRHDGERIRLTVSLIDPVDGFNLWSDRYDRSRSNPFDVQEELTGEIVNALALTLDPQVLEHHRIEPGAYYMLLRGLEPLRKFTPSGNIEARSFFERALALDPEYARAHASVAVTYGRETVFRKPAVESEAVEKGLAAAIAAIQIDPDIPHAYYALGLLNLSIREYETALAAVRHAISLDGNYSEGYALLAEVALYGGNLEEALIAIRRAKLLHPNHPPTYYWIEGHILFQLERHDDAQPFLEAAIDLQPDFYQGLVTLAANYGAQGDMVEGLKILSSLQLTEPSFDAEQATSQMSYLLQPRRSALLAGLDKIR